MLDTETDFITTTYRYDGYGRLTGEETTTLLEETATYGLTNYKTTLGYDLLDNPTFRVIDYRQGTRGRLSLRTDTHYDHAGRVDYLSVQSPQMTNGSKRVLPPALYSGWRLRKQRGKRFLAVDCAILPAAE